MGGQGHTRLLRPRVRSRELRTSRPGRRAGASGQAAAALPPDPSPGPARAPHRPHAARACARRISAMLLMPRMRPSSSSSSRGPTRSVLFSTMRSAKAICGGGAGRGGG